MSRVGEVTTEERRVLVGESRGRDGRGRVGEFKYSGRVTSEERREGKRRGRGGSGKGSGSYYREATCRGV